MTKHNGLDKSRTRMMVTPDMARAFLLRNHCDQRNIKKGHVEYLADQIRAGRWYRSSDAVAFSTEDFMINGQHRMLAIILADMAAELEFTYDLDPDAFLIIDRFSGRTAHDVTRLPTQLLADATMIWGLIHNSNNRRVSEFDQRDTVEWWKPACDAIVGGSALARKLASAGIRVGFGARWAAQGTRVGRAYVAEQFRALQKGDMDVMSHATGALWKRVIGEKFGTGTVQRHFVAVLAYYHSDPVREQVVPVLKDPQAALNELKTILSNMEAAWLNAEPGSSHPYKFDATIEQRRVTPRASERRRGAAQQEQPSP